MQSPVAVATISVSPQPTATVAAHRVLTAPADCRRAAAQPAAALAP